MNKVIGLGFDTPLDPLALGEIEDRWQERDEPVRIELATLTDPAMAGELSDRGYRLRGFENVLARRLDDLDGATPAPASPSSWCQTTTSTSGSGSRSMPSPAWTAPAAWQTRPCPARSWSARSPTCWARPV